MKIPKYLRKQILLTSLACFSVGLTGSLAAETVYVLNIINPPASSETISSCASVCTTNALSDPTDCCGTGSTLEECCTFNNAISVLGSTATIRIDPSTGRFITFGTNGDPGNTEFGSVGYDWTLEKGQVDDVRLNYNNLFSAGGFASIVDTSKRFNVIADTTISAGVVFINTYFVTNGNTLTFNGHDEFWNTNVYLFSPADGRNCTIRFQPGTYVPFIDEMRVASVAGLTTTFIADSGVDITFDGLMDFVGPAIFTGPGTFTLGGSSANTGAGEITLGTSTQPVTLSITKAEVFGTGSIIMNDGSTFGIGSGAASGTYILDNAITLPGAGSISFAAVEGTVLQLTTSITGGADFRKTGGGSVLLTGISTYTGKTYVDKGGLVITGDILASGDPIVAAGALLSGTGTIGTADVSGTIKGGNPLGTLTITGDLILGDGSSFGTTVTEAEFSQVIASGDITIGSNTTYIVVLAPGSYDSSAQLVLTGDSITGTFTNITGGAPFFLTSSLSYTDTEVRLSLEERDVRVLAVGIDAVNTAGALADAVAYNRANVTYTLDPDDGLTASPTAKLQDVLVTLAPFTTESGMTQALNQIHPAQLKGLAITQENNAVLVRDALSQRMQNEMNLSNCRDVYRDKTDCPCSKERKNTTLWVNGIGESFGQDTRTDGRGPLTGYRVNTGGFVLGGDYLFGEYFYAGALSGYTHSHLNWKSNKGSGDINSGYAGLYLSGQGEIFYGNLSVTGAWSNYKVDRKINYSDTSKIAKSSHGGSQILSHADTGLNFEWLGVTIRPFDSFDYISQTENKYTEKNAGDWNLFIEKNNPIMIRNELGLQVSACYCLPNSTWTISPKLSWVREVRVKGGNFNVEFAESGDAFTISGYFPNRSLVAPGGAVTGVMMDGALSFSLYYNGEFATGYSDNKFGGEIRYAF